MSWRRGVALAALLLVAFVAGSLEYARRRSERERASLRVPIDVPCQEIHNVAEGQRVRTHLVFDGTASAQCNMLRVQVFMQRGPIPTSYAHVEGTAGPDEGLGPTSLHDAVVIP